MTTRRERLREATFEEIKAAAWKQIGEGGPGSLSLRAVGREMGMTAPGLYRYYPSREDLVTALIVEAFDSFAAALEAARDALPAGDHLGRFRATCWAYFGWAVAHPQRYALIFAAPVPGYQLAAPAFPAARRGFLALQDVLGPAHETGALARAQDADLPAGLAGQYEALRRMGMPYSGIVTHLALAVWTHMHGIASLMLYGYLPAFLDGQVQSFAGTQIEAMAGWLGLK